MGNTLSISNEYVGVYEMFSKSFTSSIFEDIHQALEKYECFNPYTYLYIDWFSEKDVEIDVSILDKWYESINLKLKPIKSKLPKCCKIIYKKKIESSEFPPHPYFKIDNKYFRIEEGLEDLIVCVQDKKELDEYYPGDSETAIDVKHLKTELKFKKHDKLISKEDFYKIFSDEQFFLRWENIFDFYSYEISKLKLISKHVKDKDEKVIFHYF